MSQMQLPQSFKGPLDCVPASLPPNDNAVPMPSKSKLPCFLPIDSASNLDVLLCAAVLQSTVEHLVCPVQRRKGPRDRADALADQDEWYDDPECVHEHKVSPVVRRLGPRIGKAQHRLVEQARRVV